uniref:Uncharacterized protein n=1 Tax=Myoviridae sp. ctWiL39 TaxID=2825120 RepID=A0A8S5PWZ7_9CAUD|nr:MAG TPA: hypothetical protein [Myoviridae sp. ctWiL39]
MSCTGLYGTIISAYYTIVNRHFGVFHTFSLLTLSALCAILNLWR